MKIALVTFLVMIAFAANSVLTRWGVDGGHIDPAGFAIVRVLSGVVVLLLLVRSQGTSMHLFQKARLLGALSLAAYVIGFSLAYATLDAGLGALVLFGVVQITMFGWSALTGSRPKLGQFLGAFVAFGGLVLALWPGSEGAVDPMGAALMVFAGIGWAIYTLVGRGAKDPMAATASNFLICLPIVVIALGAFVGHLTWAGVVLAALSGGVTSALGYALWYNVLPKLDAATSATVQLSVPILAILAGILWLAEPVSLSVVVSCLMVVGGIGWSIRAAQG